MKEIKIEYLDISELKPNPNNPRLNDKAVDVVAKSIKEFEWRTPIVLGRDNIILSGHTRLKAAKKLGITKVPIIRADDLPENKQRAYAIMDNKSAEVSEWDMILLREELEGIVDLDSTGFEDIDGLWDTPDIIDDISLPSGDKDNLEQITFTLTADQMITVKTALEKIKREHKDLLAQQENTNTNANALHYIAMVFKEFDK